MSKLKDIEKIINSKREVLIDGVRIYNLDGLIKLKGRPESALYLEDPLVSGLGDACPSLDIEAGIYRSIDKYREYYALLKEVKDQFEAAAEARLVDLALKVDRVFWFVGGMTRYYDFQATRLLRLWSQKKQCPVIFGDKKKGYRIECPKQGAVMLDAGYFEYGYRVKVDNKVKAICVPCFSDALLKEERLDQVGDVRRATVCFRCNCKIKGFRSRRQLEEK